MKRIKIFTRSFDLRLYRISKRLYEDMGYECVRLTDQTADGYFYTMLNDKDCDIAINIDEDAFITDPDAVKGLVNLAINEGYANIGYSDGDEATNSRDKIVTNPYFNIFNLELIRTKFSRDKIRPQNFTDLEPYYAFFHWLAESFPTLYLPCQRHSDGITTVSYDNDGHIVCLHTWYSRFYSMPAWIVKFIEPTRYKHKKRIDAIISEAYGIREIEALKFSLPDKIQFILNKLVRWCIKVPQRVHRWPFKIRRKLSCKAK